jgi:RNA polymerase sigma-70 factor (ECF subfamily)
MRPQIGLRQQMPAVLPDLRAFARFLARDRGAADDLVQDTVARALAAADQFQDGSNVKAWLFTILRNIFYEQARRRRREARAIETQFALRADEAPSVSRADIAELGTMLWRLPPLLREALVLVGAQGLSYEEAAAICGTPVGTMKARVSRARSQLAASFHPADPAG